MYTHSIDLLINRPFKIEEVTFEIHMGLSMPGGVNSIKSGTVNDDYLKTQRSLDPNGSTLTYLVYDQLYGNDGNDFLTAVPIIYTEGGINYNYVNASLYGQNGNDTLTGGIGDDLLDGGTGFDFLVGGDGNDTLVDSGFDNLGGVINGGNGNDRILVNDGLYGSGGSVMTIAGGAGTDTLEITGTYGAGSSISGIERTIISATLTIQPGLLNGTGELDLLQASQIKHATGGTTDLSGYTMPATYVYNGGTYTNSSFAFGGSTGDDTLIMPSTGEIALRADALEGNDTIIGGAANDTMYGGDGNDQLFGGAGADVLFGGAGNDTLIGGLGADSMSGGLGDDTIGVDNVNDQAYGGDGFDTVYSSVSYAVQGDVEALILTGNADINATGSYGNDVLIGNVGHNVLIGLGGDDLYGVDGNGDTVVESYNGGYDEVYSSGNYTLPENTETLFLTGTAQYGTGNSGNNGLIGNDADNILDAGAGSFEVINGNGGNDLLIGGAGHDEIRGGAGNDLFRFTSPADAFNGSSNDGDLLLDFTPGQDKIQLNAAAFGIYGAVDGVSLINGPYPTTAAPTLLYTQGNGLLFYDADGVGAQNPTVLAALSGTPALQASDFTVY